MQLPDNWVFFKSAVLSKVQVYCDTGIWPFKYERFTAWLSNFDTSEDEYVALHLIDSLIVKSHDMAKSGYARLIHGELRQHLIAEKKINPISIPVWKEKLKSGGFNSILRFSAVRTHLDEGESGSLIFRLLSDEIDTNRYSLAKCTKNPKIIVLVDDFLGSGRQFIDEFSPSFQLKEKMNTSSIIYCPLIAFSKGIDALKKSLPGLTVIPSETLDESDGIFSGGFDSKFRNDQVNTVGEVQDHFLSMKIKYGANMPYWLGHEDVNLPLAFEWGCPNQTPSILWMRHSKKRDDWTSLFSRRA